MNDQEQQINELEHLAAAADAEEPAEGEFIPGQEPEPEPEQQHSTAEVLAPLLQITFGIVASRRGPHWALSDGEAKEAGEAYGAVMDKYFPEVSMGPEVTAVMVTLAIVGPRVMQDKHEAMKRAAAAKAKEQEQDQGGTDGNQQE